MDDQQVLRSMVRDDAYHFVRVLADNTSGRTELVTLGGDELLVRKRIPWALANAEAWATLMGARESRLPRIEEIYQMPDQLVVVYSYVEGRSVAEVVAQEGRMAPARAVELVAQTCEAAAALHEVGLVHRDITPGNVVVAADGAHLVDLGIARRRRTEGQHDTVVLGTWGFAAPEQYGFAQTDERADVYALGRLLGFLLTGERPDEEAYETLLADPTVVTPRLAAVIAKATAFEPSARYQSADELRAALMGKDRAPKDAVETIPVTAPTPDAQPHARRSIKEIPELGRVALAATMVLAIFWVLLTIGLIFRSETTGNPPWDIYQYGIAVITCGGAAMIVYETYRGLMRKGVYLTSQHRFGRYLIQVCKILVITLVICMFWALLLPTRFVSV